MSKLLELSDNKETAFEKAARELFNSTFENIAKGLLEDIFRLEVDAKIENLLEEKE